MRKSKKKDIKELKKINILTHAILLIVFVVFLAFLSMILFELFLTFLMDNRLEQANANAQQMAANIEKLDNIEDVSDKSKFKIDKLADFGIYDFEQKKFYIKPKMDIDIDEFMIFEFGDESVYIDGRQCVLEISKNGEIKPFSLVKYYFKEVDDKFSIDTDTLNKEVLQLPVWVKKTLSNNRYSLLYSGILVIRNKDMLYILVTFIIMMVVVFVPLALYIATLFVSVAKQKKSAKLLFYDAVTGGNNWSYFKDRARRLLKKNKSGKLHYVMVSIALERYRSYCSFHGALAGEELSEQISKCIAPLIKKKKEVFARYAEAEFGMLLIVDDLEQVTYRLDNLIDSILDKNKSHKLSFDVGLCDVIEEKQVDELYSNAALARNTKSEISSEKYYWFNEKLKEEQRWEHFVEENMEHALTAGELHVYVQPKYNAKTKKLGGAEALVRWISPTEGFIGPGKFIPIFEKNGFITQIDDFMLSSVAKLQAKWVEENRNVVPISVNISRAHFSQEDLAEHICKIVDAAGAPRNLIELELTESAFFEDKEIIINTVEKLKTMGFAISMDDFGAGYSSLNSLKDLKLDVLKIDADFFRGKEENEDRSALIVSETIRLAKKLGMTTVAEGIEHEKQVEFLAENDCDLIQGFYFAKPMPVDEYVLRMEDD